MSNDVLRKRTLGDVTYECTSRAGKGLNGLPVYGVDSKLGLTPVPKYAAKKLDKYKVIEPGMFAYNPMRLNIGSIGLCKYPYSKGLVSPDYVVFGCDTEKLLPEFLNYAIQGSEWQQWTSSAGIGSVRMRIYYKELARLFLTIPSISEQKDIVKILSTLDDKIKLTRQINQTLEEMAQAIFKSWFVDFEPVKAKIEAKANDQDPEHAAMCAISGKTNDELDLLPPDQLVQVRATAALFPDELTDSELGLIPKGWTVKTIDDVSSHIIDHRGKTPRKLGRDWVERGFPALSAKNVKSGRLINHESIRYVDENLYYKWMKEELEAGDILLTSEGPMGEMYLVSEGEKYCLSQRLYGIRADKENATPIYLYHWLKAPRARVDLESRATGTTVVGIRQSELRKVFVLSPSLAILNSFEKPISALYEKLYLNEQEILNLGELRDTLLPKLLSGELQVPIKEEKGAL